MIELKLTIKYYDYFTYVKDVNVPFMLLEEISSVACTALWCKILYYFPGALVYPILKLVLCCPLVTVTVTFIQKEKENVTLSVTVANKINMFIFTTS